MRRALESVQVWQADVAPFPASLHDDPAARPGAVIVAADGFALASEVVGRAPSETIGVAHLIGAALRSAAEAMDRWPRTVHVRHEEVATALRALLGGDVMPGAESVRVETRRHLDHVDELIIQLATDVGGWEGDIRPLSMPETWAGWGLSSDLVADLFRSAAEFWRAAPWVRLPNDRQLVITMPDGEAWVASVLGYAGQEYGFSVYSREQDFLSILSGEGVSAFDDFAGRVYGVTFDPRGRLPRRMQREVASAGWEVAAPEAYPVLMAFNTPGGGIARCDAEQLALALRAVAGLARECPEALSRGERIEWLDPETGVRAVHEEDTDERLWPLFSLWSIPERLAPAGPEGPAACPRAAFEEQDPNTIPPGLILERDLLLLQLGFEDGPDLVRKLELAARLGLTDPDEPDELDIARAWRALAIETFAGWLLVERDLSLATARRHAENADTFLWFLEDDESLPVAAVTEYDLRRFLFDWYPRRTMDPKYRIRSMPASLGHFFHWLAEANGIVCPWASATLAERDAYAARHEHFPGGYWWDEGVRAWQVELGEDLDRRVMLPDPSLGETSMWGAEGPFGRSMGPAESLLERALQRRWLVWRDEEIRGGVTEPDPLRATLVQRQHSWETSPQTWLTGDSPLEVIEGERAASAEES